MEKYYDNVYIYFNCFSFIKSLGAFYDTHLNAVKNEEELFDEDSDFFLSYSRSRFCVPWNKLFIKFSNFCEKLDDFFFQSNLPGWAFHKDASNRLIKFDPLGREMFVKYIEVDEEHTIPIYLLFFFFFLPFHFLYLFFKDKYYFNLYGRRGGPSRNYEKYSYLLNFFIRIDIIKSLYFWEQYHYWSHEYMRNRWRATNYVHRYQKTWRRHASMESWYQISIYERIMRFESVAHENLFIILDLKYLICLHVFVLLFALILLFLI